MTNPDPEKVAKLPVWAQDYIHLLERRVVELNAQLLVASAGPEDSNVLIRDHVHPDRPLGRNVPVRFNLPDGSYVEVEHARDELGTVLVRASGSGRRGAISVLPSTSNAVKLRLAEY